MAICVNCKKAISDRAVKCRYCYAEQVPDIRGDVLISSTNSFEGYEIIEYFDIAYGEVVCPNGILGAITNGTFFTFSALADARSKALETLRKSALSVGANAVVNVDIDISDLNGHGILVSVNGTPVYIVPEKFLEKQQVLREKRDELRKQEEEIQQKKDAFIAEKMNAFGDGVEEYSVLEKNIIKIILKQERPTVNNVLKGFKNVEPATCKTALNKLVNSGIIEIDEFGTCQVKIEI